MEGERSREHKKGTLEERLLFMRRARWRPCERGSSDGSNITPYPIGKGAIPGGCNSVFYITKTKEQELV